MVTFAHTFHKYFVLFIPNHAVKTIRIFCQTTLKNQIGIIAAMEMGIGDPSSNRALPGFSNLASLSLTRSFRGSTTSSESLEVGVKAQNELLFLSLSLSADSTSYVGNL